MHKNHININQGANLIEWGYPQMLSECPVKFGAYTLIGLGAVCEQTDRQIDRQTDRQTDRLIY